MEKPTSLLQTQCCCQGGLDLQQDISAPTSQSSQTKKQEEQQETAMVLSFLLSTTNTTNLRFPMGSEAIVWNNLTNDTRAKPSKESFKHALLKSNTLNKINFGLKRN